MNTNTTRRALLKAAPIGAAIMAFPAVAATGDDSAIIEAWHERKAAFARYNVLPYADNDSTYTPAETACWAIIDRAEETIRASVAMTPRGTAVQLWVTFQHGLTDRADDEAAQAADLAYFTDDSRFDWTEKVAIAALRSLAAQGGVL